MALWNNRLVPFHQLNAEGRSFSDKIQYCYNKTGTVSILELPTENVGRKLGHEVYMFPQKFLKCRCKMMRLSEP